jgi:superfamily II DNA/RNA helicase
MTAITVIKIFSPEIFFSPAADSSGGGSSTSGGAVSTKSVCPFVRTLTAGLPSYKKALRVPDTAEHRGSPIVVIVCSSAVRATKIIKSLSTHKHIHCKIAKLFAKHIKIAEQIEMLAAETYPIAIGTPNRLTKLLGLGALHLQNTRLLIVDVTADVKNMTILNMNGVRDDLTSLLHTYIAKELQHIKIALVRDKRDVE